MTDKKNSTETESNQISRKKFITQLGMAGAAFSIVPRHVLGGKGFIAPSDTLYIAGIGAGGKGNHDMREFASHPNVKIAAFCDVDERQATRSVNEHPDATFYKDFRVMLEEEKDTIDAVSVSTPDHNHAIHALPAMQMGKHVYVQKPMTHDIYEARILTQAAEQYKVVTQMGNQGSSGDGVRKLTEWYEAGLIGEVEEVWIWTDRPVWPQGIERPGPAPIPAELDWDMWLGTAPEKNYFENLAPFNWRGWWDYGTGALGDIGCHMIETPYAVLGLEYPDRVECSVGSVYTGPFRRAYYPESCPPSSHVVLNFPGKNGANDVTLHWMDGGIQPQRPEELGPNELMGDGGNGILFIGDKGKMMCGIYAENPRLLPTSRTEEVDVPETIARVPEGHYHQWVNGCLAGYGNSKLSSSFDIAGPLTEIVLMGNLAIRSYDLREEYLEEYTQDDGTLATRMRTRYPGRHIQLLWDGPNMRITNFEPANQFVKRDYRDGWSLEV